MNRVPLSMFRGFVWLLILPFLDVSNVAAQKSDPPIGGSYALSDHMGNPVTEKTYLGKFQIVTFGYTFCPDVCPTTLSTLAEILDHLGTDGDAVQTLFITLDPVRDTPDVLADYVGHFHPKLIGLYGSVQKTKQVAGAYQVQYRKVKGEEQGEYHFEHSAVHYLMDKTGAYIGHLEHDVAPIDAAKAIRGLMLRDAS